MLPRRVVPSDVVTYTHDFAQRRSSFESPTDRAAHTQPGAQHEDTVHGLARAQEPTGARGVPSNPVVYRIREDLTWEDVLRNSSPPVRQFINGVYLLLTLTSPTLANFLIESYQKLEDIRKKPYGYWITEQGRNMRGVLESLSKSNGFDPLVADHWYNVSRRDFILHRVSNKRGEE